MEEPSAVGHAFEPYIGGGAMPAESSLDGEEDEDFNEETESMDEDDLIEECDGVIGAAYMVDVGMDSAMVLNY